MPERLQEILPAQRADREIEEHRRERERQPRRMRAGDCDAHAPQIDVVEKQREQCRRQQHDDRGSKM